LNFTLAENLALREYNTPKMSDHGWPRATARSRQGDTKAAIIDYLKKHPGSLPARSLRDSTFSATVSPPA
jgi:hypothetical protein